MGLFTFKKCLDIEGLYTIEPKIFSDERGYNLETYNSKDFNEAGLNMEFVQANRSMSKKGTLRGYIFKKHISKEN